MFSYNEQQLFCTQYIFLNGVCILLHASNQQGQVAVRWPLGSKSKRLKIQLVGELSKRHLNAEESSLR